MQEQARYLQELKPYVTASALLIGTGIAFGIVSAVYAPGIVTEFRESFVEFARVFRGLPKPYLALAIFLNNAVKVLVVIIVGTLWGILPVVFLVANGFAIGIVLYSSIQSQGAFPTLLMILPHGLFEIPAILLGTSAGLMLGLLVTKRLFGKGGRVITKEMGRALKFFLVVIIPLLLLAASIEAFLSS